MEYNVSVCSGGVIRYFDGKKTFVTVIINERIMSDKRVSSIRYNFSSLPTLHQSFFVYPHLMNSLSLYY